MIHPSAIIDDSASIADDVEIGPFSIIGSDVTIGRGTKIGPHTTIEGPTFIGENNHIYQYASLGTPPQDKKYRGEPTPLYIGDGNTIREFVTINRGTSQDIGYTRIGDDNWIMSYVHIAHDCVLGSNIIMANNASLAGHVRIDDHVILGGYTLIYQFCRLGRNAFTAFGAHINKDVPPFVMAAGSPAKARGLNLEGLKRHQFDPQDIKVIKQAYRILYRQGHTKEYAIKHCQDTLGDNPYVETMLSFIQHSRHGILQVNDTSKHT